MSVPRVMVVGSHLGYAEHMDAGMIRAFKALGYAVETFDYRASAVAPSWLKRLVPAAVRHRLNLRRVASVDAAESRAQNFDFIARLDRARPELLLCLQAERLTAASLEEARRRGIFTINWIADEPWRAIPSAVVPLYDLWATIDPTWAEWLVARGAAHVEHLPIACDPSVHRPIALTEAERRVWCSPLCFVGGYGEIREKILAAVAEDGLAIWGPNWHKSKSASLRRCVRKAALLSRDEWQRAFAAADVVLNVHAQGQECLNMRVFEAMAARVCLLTDYKRDVDRVLGGVVESFRSPDELRGKSRALLADPDRRRTLAQKAYETVMSAHTFAHRGRKILDWFEKAERHSS